MWFGILLLALLAGLFGLGLLAGLFTYTSPPMKEYEYHITPSEFHNFILDLDKGDRDLKCHVTDTVGMPDCPAYYMDVKMRKNGTHYDFRIRFKSDSSFWTKTPYLNIGLFSAFDKTNKIGGNKEDIPGIEPIIAFFENKLVAHLDTKFKKR